MSEMNKMFYGYIQTAWSGKRSGTHGLYAFVVGKWRPMGIFVRTPRTSLKSNEIAKIVTTLWYNLGWKKDGLTYEEAYAKVEILPPSGKILDWSHEDWQYNRSLGGR